MIETHRQDARGRIKKISCFPLRNLMRKRGRILIFWDDHSRDKGNGGERMQIQKEDHSQIVERKGENFESINASSN